MYALGLQNATLFKTILANNNKNHNYNRKGLHLRKMKAPKYGLKDRGLPSALQEVFRSEVSECPAEKLHFLFLFLRVFACSVNCPFLQNRLNYFTC